MPRWLSGVALAARALLAAFFLFMAWRNLSGDAGMAADFARWGYPDGFRVFTAVLQIVGAVALLLPGTAFWGAAVLAVVLLGAIGTHLLHDPPATALVPLAFLAVVSALLVRSRPAFLR